MCLDFLAHHAQKKSLLNEHGHQLSMCQKWCISRIEMLNINQITKQKSTLASYPCGGCKNLWPSQNDT